MDDIKNEYIDGFAFPIPKAYLEDYKKVAQVVARIWKEHGALSYFEYVAEDLKLEGTRPFTEVLDAKSNETIIFGWVVFESRKARDLANKRVAADPRMEELINPLIEPSKMIFDAVRMAYGGFQRLV
ncbi:MAG: DUF1428 domain-containing protein [Saprospiraceae bacterium]|nr:DUF1428 domain-containing protein [Saprospiraceae bacterium]